MKKLSVLLIFAAGLFSCSNSTDKSAQNAGQVDSDSAKTDIIADVKKLNEVLASIEDPSQKFNVPANKPGIVTGRAGTIIEINPSNLTTASGKPLGKTIQVELKELTNTSELARAGAQTTAGGKLLVSGGAYYLNMYSDGEELKIIEGKFVNVKLPKISKEPMELFYGQRDSMGRMDWQKDNQAISYQQKADYVRKKSFGEANDPFGDVVEYLQQDTAKLSPGERKSIRAEAKSYTVISNAIKLKAFGWINCDRFLGEPNLTDIVAKVNTKQFGTTSIVLIFKDINSIRNEYASSKGIATLTNLPVNRAVKIIAYAIKGEQIYTFAQDFKVSANQTIVLDLKADTRDGLKNLFN